MGGRGEGVCATLSGGDDGRPVGMGQEGEGFCSQVLPVASCPLTRGSGTWLLLVGLSLAWNQSIALCGGAGLEAA